MSEERTTAEITLDRVMRQCAAITMINPERVELSIGAHPRVTIYQAGVMPWDKKYNPTHMDFDLNDDARLSVIAATLQEIYNQIKLKAA